MPGFAADALMSARRHARISQAELARRAGVPRSVVNAYERGKRQPGADALAQLLAAAGVELRTVGAVQRPDPDRAARILVQVLDLAEVLPVRHRRTIAAAPFRS